MAKTREGGATPTRYERLFNASEKLSDELDDFLPLAFRVNLACEMRKEFDIFMEMMLNRAQLMDEHGEE